MIGKYVPEPNVSDTNCTSVLALVDNIILLELVGDELLTTPIRELVLDPFGTAIKLVCPLATLDLK